MFFNGRAMGLLVTDKSLLRFSQLKIIFFKIKMSLLSSGITLRLHLIEPHRLILEHNLPWEWGSWSPGGPRSTAWRWGWRALRALTPGFRCRRPRRTPSGSARSSRGRGGSSFRPSRCRSCPETGTPELSQEVSLSEKGRQNQKKAIHVKVLGGEREC